jgi:hypothetical protein
MFRDPEDEMFAAVVDILGDPLDAMASVYRQCPKFDPVMLSDLVFDAYGAEAEEEYLKCGQDHDWSTFVSAIVRDRFPVAWKHSELTSISRLQPGGHAANYRAHFLRAYAHRLLADLDEGSKADVDRWVHAGGAIPQVLQTWASAEGQHNDK